MSKKTKAPKVSKKKEENLHLEVVLLDDVCEVLMKNVFRSMDILRDVCSIQNVKKIK